MQAFESYYCYDCGTELEEEEFIKDFCPYCFNPNRNKNYQDTLYYLESLERPNRPKKPEKTMTDFFTERAIKTYHQLQQEQILKERKNRKKGRKYNTRFGNELERLL